MSFTLHIGSRPSALALAQANLVKDALLRTCDGLAIEIVPISTSGDKMQTASLAGVGGKGLFVRELEQALSAHRIDLAVHSMKDMPAVPLPQYRLAAVPVRESPCDALLAAARANWDSLPKGARLGTSSSRRRFEALRIRPDLNVMPLRGNIDTRLRRLANADFDAIILAMAGVRRLGLTVNGERPNGSVTFNELNPSEFVPCGGQGALAVEALNGGPIAGSSEIEDAVTTLTDLTALAEVSAERGFLATIGASCVSPVGVIGVHRNNTLTLRALLFSLDGARSLADEVTSDPGPEAASTREQIQNRAEEIGALLAHRMLDHGARELIGRD